MGILIVKSKVKGLLFVNYTNKYTLGKQKSKEKGSKKRTGILKFAFCIADTKLIFYLKSHRLAQKHRHTYNIKQYPQKQ